MAKLIGKVAIVTGASKGIGAGIAEDLAKQGASVVVNYSSSPDQAAKVVANIKAAGGKAKAIRANISKLARQSNSSKTRSRNLVVSTSSSTTPESTNSLRYPTSRRICSIGSSIST